MEQKTVIDMKTKSEEGVGSSALGENSTTNGTSNGHASSLVDSSTEGDIKALAPPGSDMATADGATEAEEDDEEDQLDDDDGEDIVAPTKEEDELSSEGEATGGGAVGAGGILSLRRAALEEKRMEKKLQDAARVVELAKARSEAKAKSAERKQADRVRTEVEDQLKANSKKDDWVEREFRRYQGVARCRPLGKDRFFNRYWWFDGVGGMNLVGQNNSILYGTGRLFVQGPTEDEYELAMQKEGGKLRLEERRKREEVESRSILNVDEWAFYENEDEVSSDSTSVLVIALDTLPFRSTLFRLG